MVGSYVYDPYGRTTTNNDNAGTTAPDNPFRYLSGYQDAQEGDNLYHFGARYYNPTLGHFTGPDPQNGDISDPKTFESYGYAENDPMN